MTSATLKQRILAAAEKEVVSVDGHEWPFKRKGMMSIESQSEDGEWDAYATSEDATGANLAWLDPIKIAVVADDEAVIPRAALLALADVAEAAGALMHNYAEEKLAVEEHRRRIIHLSSERMLAVCEALRALERRLEEGK